MSTKKTLEAKIVVNRNKLKWVASALSKDKHRVSLAYAIVESFGGNNWLVATDTWRMHILRLHGHVPEGRHMLNIRRMLHEASFIGPGAIDFGISYSGKTPTVEILDGNGDAIETIISPLGGEGVPLNWTQVISKTDWQGSFPGAAFNFRYLRDMSAVTDSNRVVLMGGNEYKPFFLAEKRQDPLESEWFAVIMPMALR